MQSLQFLRNISCSNYADKLDYMQSVSSDFILLLIVIFECILSQEMQKSFVCNVVWVQAKCC